MENAAVIDFESNETHLLLNPRMPDEERTRLERLAREFPLHGHVWIATSGTSGALKLTALSKEALLTSAAGVNQHLDARSDDAWLCVLPTFHVGGLGIYARAHLAGARVVAAEWDAVGFAETCAKERIAFSSLVPAQVSDLVRARVMGSPSLRAIVVGGGAFAPELYDEARALGWPVLPSYGMTECSSQVATARGESPDLIVLPHVEVRIGEESRIVLASRALLSGYAMYIDDEPAFVDPRVGGVFVTEDTGTIEGEVLRVEGRRGAFVKIGGESVDLRRLDAVLERVIHELGGGFDAAVLPVPDERLGHVIALAHAGGEGVRIAEAFGARVMPYERIRAVRAVPAIPRTALGKLRRRELEALVR